MARSLIVYIQELGLYEEFKSHQNVSLNASLITASYCPRFHQLGMPWDEWIFFFTNANVKGKIKSDCFLHNY